MKIGIDARLYGSTGIGRYTRNLITELAKIDKKNDYYIFIRDQSGVKAPAQNFHLVETPIPHYSLAEQIELPKILNRYKLDLVHFAHFNRPIFYHGRSIITIHDLILHHYPGGRLKSYFHQFFYRIVIKKAVHKSDRVIAVSHSTKTDVVQLLKVPTHKVKVIHEGVEDNFKPVEQKLIDQVLKKYAINRPYILYIGVWRIHKNIGRLVQAFDRLCQSVKIKPRLVLTGKPEATHPQVVRQINASQNRQLILTPGFIDEEDLPALYSGAEIFVLPSLYEGFGLPILEAMACGVPVACSNTTSLPEVAGSAAILFDPLKQEEMTRSLIRLYSDQNLQKKLIQKGFKQIKQFSWSKNAKQTLSLYNQIVEEVK